MVIISCDSVLYGDMIYGRIIDGSVAEWLKAHDSKSCGLATVSEVRILSLPPKNKIESLLSYFVFRVE